MKFLDIAVAALIGVSTITGIVAWSPQSGDSMSRQTATETQLRDALLAFLSERGILWLILSSPSAACVGFQGLSNSSVSVSASFGSYTCGLRPGGASGVATLSMRLGTVEVVLKAWPNAVG
jgi:hypothetical protein